jgi:hypothetical protein
MTYAELVQKIRDYTEVGSEVLTATIVDGFIRDAELKIFRETDADYAREYATSTFTANNKFVALPNASGSSGTNSSRRALVVRSVVVTNSSSVQVSLEPRDDTFITEYNSTGATGFPKYYAMFRENSIEVAPTPDAAFVVALDYIYTPDGLSVTNTETYVSLNAPELLLYACLVEAFAYLKGPMDMYKLYQDKYNTALQGFALEQTGRRRRDEFQDGTLRIKVPSPSP